MKMPFWVKVLLSIVVMQVLGGLGAAVTSGQITDWYANLRRPPGTPPNWIFGPVWITLYAMIGTAFAIIWHRGKPGNLKNAAMLAFGVQLLLNLAWTPVFFGMHRMLIALVIICALWLTIVITIFLFRKLQPIAALLLVPYLIWVTYASYLNAGYWFFNLR